jgi:hypothetical protein
MFVMDGRPKETRFPAHNLFDLPFVRLPGRRNRLSFCSVDQINELPDFNLFREHKTAQGVDGMNESGATTLRGLNAPTLFLLERCETGKTDRSSNSVFCIRTVAQISQHDYQHSMTEFGDICVICHLLFQIIGGDVNEGRADKLRSYKS